MSEDIVSSKSAVSNADLGFLSLKESTALELFTLTTPGSPDDFTDVVVSDSVAALLPGKHVETDLHYVPVTFPQVVTGGFSAAVGLVSLCNALAPLTSGEAFSWVMFDGNAGAFLCF